MEHPPYYAQDMSQHHSPWIDQQPPPSSHGYQSQHHSPIHEFPGFGFHTPTYDSHTYHSRPTHQQLQPIITTQWPSALATQQPGYNHAAPGAPPPPPLQPSPLAGPQAMAGALPPPSSSHGTSATTSTPRRTLTDADRRKMCLYHEEYPMKKQTEIGEIFGVERSTVSKVLRQKEKYLNLNDGSQSPVRKVKKHPDIERTLAKWATNQQSKGVLVTDDLLKNQARLWWLASGNAGDIPVKIDSPGWLEKFRQKYGLSGSKSRKSSLKSISSPLLGSPISPELDERNDSPLHIDTPSLARHDSSNLEGLGIQGARAPFHSQSNTSLSSAFTDHAPPFSSDGGSTAVSPDGVSSASSYFPPAMPTSSTNMLRSRSQTLPISAAGDVYMSPPQSADPVSPHYSAATAVFDSPNSDMPPPSAKPFAQHSVNPPQTVHAVKSMPSLKAKCLQDADLSKPTIADARRGLEAAILYLNSNATGYPAHEIAAIKRIMSQLKLQESGSMPGGLHRIPEQEFGRGEDDIELPGSMSMGRPRISPRPTATTT